MYQGMEQLGGIADPVIENNQLERFAYLNYFGEELSEQIGRDRLQTAPVHEIDEISGGFAMRPFENIHIRMRENTGEIAKHLGPKFV